MRTARRIWCLTSSNSKTSILVRPQVNDKPEFFFVFFFEIKLHSDWGPVTKPCVFGAPKLRLRADVKRDKKKSPFSNYGYAVWTGPFN